jgi:hypothetical protein
VSSLSGHVKVLGVGSLTCGEDSWRGKLNYGLETETDMGEGDTSDGAYPMKFVYEFDEDGKIIKQVKRKIDTSSFFE